MPDKAQNNGCVMSLTLALVILCSGVSFILFPFFEWNSVPLDYLTSGNIQ
jgi:hypothetical protein